LYEGGPKFEEGKLDRDLSASDLVLVTSVAHNLYRTLPNDETKGMSI
jgi:hypothetical protein